MKKGYIYKITSTSGRIYMGQTIDIKRRKTTYSKYRCKGQKRLYDSLVKHGWENHLFEILEEREEDYSLNEREIYWIKVFDSYKNGLNMTEGGKVIRLNEESLKKISEALKGEKNYMYGKNIKIAQRIK
jgi:group I intron endonuclease